MDPSASFLEFVFQDWAVNSNSFKSRIVLVFFRYVQFLKTRSGIIGTLFASPFSLIYTIIVQWLMGIEIPYTVTIGKDLKLSHAVGLVVHPAAVIGHGCLLRQCTTIGAKAEIGTKIAPVLGNCVDVGCNSVIIGHINVGDNAVIGAASVVVRDVPENAVVCGNPARVIRIQQPEICKK